MKRLWLVTLVFFCMAGVVCAAMPNPWVPNLTGGSWRGNVRSYDLTAGTTAIVAVKIAFTAQTSGLLTANVNVGNLSFVGVHGFIDGTYVYVNASSAAGSIYIYGNLGYYPYPAIVVNSISAGGKVYGDTILYPNENP